MLTVTPGSTASESSVTVPVIAAVVALVVCASALGGDERHQQRGSDRVTQHRRTLLDRGRPVSHAHQSGAPATSTCAAVVWCAIVQVVSHARSRGFSECNRCGRARKRQRCSFSPLTANNRVSLIGGVRQKRRPQRGLRDLRDVTRRADADNVVRRCAGSRRARDTDHARSALRRPARLANGLLLRSAQRCVDSYDAPW